MAREGKKVHEFDLWTQNEHRNRDRRFSAVLRMNDSLQFTLEVNGLKFEGKNPADLTHQAQMQLENEQDLKWESRILVDPDLEEGRLMFRRVFVAKSKDDRDVYRAWRFSGDDEHRVGRWNTEIPKTFELLEGATPGDRTDEARLKDRKMEYTPERWQALVKLDQMLKEAHKAVADKLHDIIRKGDLDGFLKRATAQGTPRLIFDEAVKANG